MSINPGDTQLTRIFGAYSSAASIVSEITPAFAAEYGPSNRVGRTPHTDAWFTMQPPRSRISGTAARMPWNVPARLTPTIFGPLGVRVLVERHRGADAGVVEQHREPAERRRPRR